jgi:serine phosphatase RsbU (regulator of sigma subunit)
MEDDGTTSIAVHGMAGWIHVNNSGAKLITARGQALGAVDQISVDITTIKLDVGDFIFSFSDGCLEGSRPISKLIRTLSKQPQRILISPDEIFALINEIGKDVVHADDKAMIYIRRTA